MRQKENYVAPELTVVEFKVEKGFAVSGEPDVELLGGIMFGEVLDNNTLHMSSGMDDVSGAFTDAGVSGDGYEGQVGTDGLYGYFNHPIF